MTDRLGRLPLQRVVAAEWIGVRSLFREGWTGIAGDCVCLYHWPAAGDPTESWIETTTYVDGGWLEPSTLDFMLTDRATAVGDRSESEIEVDVDGRVHSFFCVTRGSLWAALARSRDPVVTVLAAHLAPGAVSLVTVASAELDGAERFAPG